MQGPGWPREVLAQSAVLTAVPGEDDVRTEVAIAAKAHLTLPTRQGRIHRDGHPVTGSALDDSREFVPWHHRPGQLRVADARLGEPVQVGTAQPDRRDAHQFL